MGIRRKRTTRKTSQASEKKNVLPVNGSHDLPLFDSAIFVAWDGEGETVNGQHCYTSLAACYSYDLHNFEYRQLYRGGQRLTTPDIIDFMLEVVGDIDYPAIHVGFGLSYDMTHWLFDLSERDAAYAMTSQAKRWGQYRTGDTLYQFKTIPRKQFRARVMQGRRVTGRITIWDVFGFFQTSFLGAVRLWLGRDYSDYDLLKTGKENRKVFETWAADDIEAYNRAELIATIRIMENVRTAVKLAGFTLARWDGAGALASAFYKRFLRKGWFQDSIPPRDIETAATYAYFGGRIEQIRYGWHEGLVWHGDINSAYPAAMTTLPDLTAGTWRAWEAGEPIRDYALYLVAWEHVNAAGIGPFPYRLHDNGVVFPSQGRGWVWGVELQAGQRLANQTTHGHITVEKGWVFDPHHAHEKPFGWIQELYNQRAALVQRAKKGDVGADGQQKILKLGLNSLYGKTAQKVGYTQRGQTVTLRYAGEIETYHDYDAENKYPPFYSLLVAGYITAHCRAQLLTAAATNPAGVIAFATDGVYSTQPLTVPTAEQKILGLWEVETMTRAKLLQVQPGVYYLHDGEHWHETCRGLIPVARYDTPAANDDAIEKRVKELRAEYRKVSRNRGHTLPVIETRFMTLKQALAQNWAKRGQWDHTTRHIRLYNPSSKRVPVGRYRSLAENLCDTNPNDGLVLFSGQALSKAYDGLPPQSSDYAVVMDEQYYLSLEYHGLL